MPNTQNIITMPVVIERSLTGERAYDLPSKLLENRIILIDSGVNTDLAHAICAQLLYLDSVSNSDITMYINSPGGAVHDGLKIADQMELCRSDISTVCTGLGASMGCFLTSMGAPGKRYMTRRATLMAHQVSSGTQGLITDQKIALQHSEHLNKVLMQEMADRVGVSYEEILAECDRDKWMTATEARDFGKLGFVDAVYTGVRGADDSYEVQYRDGSTKFI